MSLITVSSWANLGFRKMGQLPPATGELAAAAGARVLQQAIGYEIVDNNWVRRTGRKKGSSVPPAIRIVDTINAGETISDNRFAYIEDFFQKGYAKHNKFRVKNETLKEIMSKADSQPTAWQRAYEVGVALSAADVSQLRPLLKDYIIPWFFKCYKNGKILVLSYNYEYEQVTSSMRGFYAAAQAPITDFSGADFKGFQTLKHWHASHVYLVGRNLIDILNYLMYPQIAGYQAGPLGLTFLLLFDQAEQFHAGPFPQDWLAIPRSHAGFAEEDRDHSEVLTNPNSQARAQAVHKRYLHKQNFSAAEQLEFVQWFVNVFNRYYYELTDIANFTEDGKTDSAIDPISALEHYITIDRLIRKTLAVVSTNEPLHTKGLVFEVADLYDSLSERWGHTAKKSTQFFKDLFKVKQAATNLKQILAVVPGTVGSYVRTLVDTLYLELEEKTVKSVWRSKNISVTPPGILVPSKKGGSPKLETHEEFVANLMRAYRNGHHGYFSSADEAKRPSRYLSLVDGNVPDSITSLPSLWLLAYLANPSFVGWHYLDINAYE